MHLGIDLGGTRIKAGLVDARGRVQERHEIDARAGEGPDAVIRRIAALATELGRGVRRFGVGAPGPMDAARTRVLFAPNLPGWRDVPLRRALERATGKRVVIENDANLAAWGEYVAGAGRGARSLALLTLGTGVGGGIVLDGRLWTGASGAGAELGHVPIESDGRACPCGGRGCLERYASGPAIARAARCATAAEAFRAARRGDARARRAIREAAEALAAAIAGIIHAIEPERILLGGGIMRSAPQLLPLVRRLVRGRVFAILHARVRIARAALGPDAGWIGAALWGAGETGGTRAPRLRVRP